MYHYLTMVYIRYINIHHSKNNTSHIYNNTRNYFAHIKYQCEHIIYIYIYTRTHTQNSNILQCIETTQIILINIEQYYNSYIYIYICISKCSMIHPYVTIRHNTYSTTHQPFKYYIVWKFNNVHIL